jgi:hypothetical protein
MNYFLEKNLLIVLSMWKLTLAYSNPLGSYKLQLPLRLLGDGPPCDQHDLLKTKQKSSFIHSSCGFILMSVIFCQIAFRKAKVRFRWAAHNITCLFSFLTFLSQPTYLSYTLHGHASMKPESRT